MSNDDTTYDHQIYILGGESGPHDDPEPQILVFKLGSEERYWSLHLLETTLIQRLIGLNMI